jgi:farnesyl-diphosphate farnesyltransferase
MPLTLDAIDVLRKTSRTFFIPIIRLPGQVRDAVGSAYLCMRSIDEIEDHPALDPQEKVRLLLQTAEVLTEAAARGNLDPKPLQDLFEPHRKDLPKVTLALGSYAAMAPSTIATRVWSSVADMARQMAHWVQDEFTIRSEHDLDVYTYDVAGRVGELLNEIWLWYDGTRADQANAVGFGRGLQAVNIIRNRQEDLSRGVDFYPANWTDTELQAYILRQFDLADAYMDQLPKGPIREFCRVPLVLAKATVQALASGESKLSRSRVLELVGPEPEHLPG